MAMLPDLVHREHSVLNIHIPQWCSKESITVNYIGGMARYVVDANYNTQCAIFVLEILDQLSDRILMLATLSDHGGRCYIRMLYYNTAIVFSYYWQLPRVNEVSESTRRDYYDALLLLMLLSLLLLNFLGRHTHTFKHI